jgi:hypothetical protein
MPTISIAPRNNIEITVDVLVASFQRAGLRSHEFSLGVGYNLYRSGKDVVHNKVYSARGVPRLGGRLYDSQAHRVEFRRMPHSPYGRDLNTGG